MKAIRKSDGKVIEVEQTTSYNGELGYWDSKNCDFHYPSDLDFNVEEAEEVTIDGWLTRSVSGNIVFSDSSEWYGIIKRVPM